MITELKLLAIETLNQDFYPENVIEHFKKNSSFNIKCPWLREIQTRRGLKNYIDCLDTTFCGNPEVYLPKRKEMLQQHGISPRKLECFHLLNHIMLQEAIRTETFPYLLDYYRLILSLNDGTAVYERDKIKALIHKKEAKIINSMAENQKLPVQSVKKFLLITALFAEHELSHDSKTRAKFYKICNAVKKQENPTLSSVEAIPAVV